MATLTYAYSEQTAVVGPLVEVEDPHSWDLCEVHGDKITAPVGWELLRVDTVDIDDDDDLLALAEAVREAGRVTTGLVEGDGHGSGSDPIDYRATFDGADPQASNHPVFRTRRVAVEKQRRRSHLSVVPDHGADAAEASGATVSTIMSSAADSSAPNSPASSSPASNDSDRPAD